MDGLNINTGAAPVGERVSGTPTFIVRSKRGKSYTNNFWLGQGKFVLAAPGNYGGVYDLTGQSSWWINNAFLPALDATGFIFERWREDKEIFFTSSASPGTVLGFAPDMKQIFDGPFEV